MTEVCVKTWPFDVWTTKEMLEVKEVFGGEEEEGAVEVFVELVDEGAAFEVLDVAALDEVIEEDELLAGLEELEGAAADVAEVDGATTGADVGVLVSLVVVAGVSVVSGVVTGVVAGD
jgi:hypothetical protein